MPRGSGAGGGEEDEAAQDVEPQEQAAADLAEDAAESVDRRYDATKELHLDRTDRDGPDRDDDGR